MSNPSPELICLGFFLFMAGFVVMMCFLFPIVPRKPSDRFYKFDLWNYDHLFTWKK